uniref:C2 domain-containing protein n=1 Tax=Macrostomum lignano TaxID=282301 RepID=A0A1I8F529_9PLAT
WRGRAKRMRLARMSRSMVRQDCVYLRPEPARQRRPDRLYEVHGGLGLGCGQRWYQEVADKAADGQHQVGGRVHADADDAEVRQRRILPACSSQSTSRLSSREAKQGAGRDGHGARRVRADLDTHCDGAAGCGSGERVHGLGTPASQDRVSHKNRTLGCPRSADLEDPHGEFLENSLRSGLARLPNCTIGPGELPCELAAAQRGGGKLRQTCRGGGSGRAAARRQQVVKNCYFIGEGRAERRTFRWPIKHAQAARAGPAFPRSTAVINSDNSDDEEAPEPWRSLRLRGAAAALRVTGEAAPSTTSTSSEADRRFFELTAADCRSRRAAVWAGSVSLRAHRLVRPATAPPVWARLGPAARSRPVPTGGFLLATAGGRLHRPPAAAPPGLTTRRWSRRPPSAGGVAGVRLPDRPGVADHLAWPSSRRRPRPAGFAEKWPAAELGRPGRACAASVIRATSAPSVAACCRSRKRWRSCRGGAGGHLPAGAGAAQWDPRAVKRLEVLLASTVQLRVTDRDLLLAAAAAPTPSCGPALAAIDLLAVYKLPVGPAGVDPNLAPGWSGRFQVVGRGAQHMRFGSRWSVFFMLRPTSGSHRRPPALFSLHANNNPRRLPAQRWPGPASPERVSRTRFTPGPAQPGWRPYAVGQASQPLLDPAAGAMDVGIATDSSGHTRRCTSTAAGRPAAAVYRFRDRLASRPQQRRGTAALGCPSGCGARAPAQAIQWRLPLLRRGGGPEGSSAPASFTTRFAAYCQ